MPVFQLSSGNVYEAGQLNLLCVLELTNHALQLLRDEHRLLSDAPRPHLNPAHLQEKRQQMARVLQNLHLIRYALSLTSQMLFICCLSSLFMPCLQAEDF